MYYLQSRYYNPALGRFINSDAFASTGQGLLGNNMFAYCLNNPANYFDSSGTYAVPADEVQQWWLYLLGWLPFVDGALPLADSIYVIGFLLLGVDIISNGHDSYPELSYEETEAENCPPPPNKNDDDDDDDDYYDTESNFGGRKKIGKGKGKTPGNNQKQNKQFKDATKGLLDKDKRRALHDAISGEGLGFHEIKEMAKNIWIFFIDLFSDDDK